MAFPDDAEFYEGTITEVRDGDAGFEVGYDGFFCFLDKKHGIEPKIGQTIRFYGQKLGRFRGIFIDGVKAFYRTKAEDDEHHEIELYGADAADWLKRWDEGRSVWSIEMGGLGPGYEQCIHVTAAEILRHLLDAKYDHSLWSDKDVWSRDRDAIEKYGFASERIKELGLSGAQWGAAVSLSTALYAQGPRAVMNNPKIKDRHILVSDHFPSKARAA